jgi:hypothetical protein
MRIRSQHTGDIPTKNVVAAAPITHFVLLVEPTRASDAIGALGSILKRWLRQYGICCAAPARDICDTPGRPSLPRVPSSQSPVIAVARQLAPRALCGFLIRASTHHDQAERFVSRLSAARANKLVGFATIAIDNLKLVVRDVAIHQKDGMRWASLPVRDGELVKDSAQALDMLRGVIVHAIQKNGSP